MIIFNYLIISGLRKPAAKIGGPFETAKRILLKSVKGFEKVVYRLYRLYQRHYRRYKRYRMRDVRGSIPPQFRHLVPFRSVECVGQAEQVEQER